MKKVIGIVLIFVFLGFSTAWANEEDPRVAIIKDILEATNYKLTMETLRSSIPAQIRANLAASGHTLTEEQLVALGEVTQEELDAMGEELMGITIRLYMEYFTEQELRDILTFYQTESGKTMSEKLPLLMTDFSQTMSRLMGEMFPRLQARISERFKALEESDESES